MNPVSKSLKIVKEITDNVYSQNKLMEVMTHNLTIKEIELLFNKLKLCSEDLKN
tara:strand:+ start:343 stop:504 length:162 start_codon:yes stop_codon:yes gene_type:complete